MVQKGKLEEQVWQLTAELEFLSNQVKSTNFKSPGISVPVVESELLVQNGPFVVDLLSLSRQKCLNADMSLERFGCREHVTLGELARAMPECVEQIRQSQTLRPA